MGISMKKILLLVSVLSALLVGCTYKKEDPWKDYHSKTSAEIFHQGERNLVKHRYSKAVKDFEALDALYPFGPYAQQGQMDIIYALYKDDEKAAGLAAADRYIRLYPQDPHIDYVYYMKGIMSFDRGFNWYESLFHIDPSPHDLSDKRESFTAFNHVIRVYPHSIYGQDSALHIAFIRNLMARKEMVLADFYMKRKAYIAAANRAASVVQHYSGSPSAPHALEVMAIAYRAAGLPDLGNKSYRILEASYPDSPEFKRLSMNYNKT